MVLGEAWRHKLSRTLWESLNNRLMSTRGLISRETLQNTADKVIWPDSSSQLLALNEHWPEELTNRGSHWQQECNIGLSAPQLIQLVYCQELNSPQQLMLSPGSDVLLSETTHGTDGLQGCPCILRNQWIILKETDTCS